MALRWGCARTARAGTRRWLCMPSLVARVEAEAALELRRDAPSVDSLVAILRRLGTACRAACEPAATVALVRYVDTVAAHPAFVNDGAASSAAATTTTLAPFLRAACAEAAASGVGGDRTSDSHGVGDDWLDNLVGAAVAASAPNGSESADAVIAEMLGYRPIDGGSNAAAAAADATVGVYSHVSRLLRTGDPRMPPSVVVAAAPAVLKAAAAAERPAAAESVLCDIAATGQRLLLPPGAAGPMLASAVRRPADVSSAWFSSVATSLCVAGYEFSPADITAVASIGRALIDREGDTAAPKVFRAAVRCAGTVEHALAAIAHAAGVEGAAGAAKVGVFYAGAFAAERRFAASRTVLGAARGAGARLSSSESCLRLVRSALEGGDTMLAAAVLTEAWQDVASRSAATIEVAGEAIRECAIRRDTRSAESIIAALCGSDRVSSGRSGGGGGGGGGDRGSGSVRVPAETIAQWKAHTVYAFHGGRRSAATVVGIDDEALPIDTIAFAICRAVQLHGASPGDDALPMPVANRFASRHTALCKSSMGNNESPKGAVVMLPVVDAGLWGCGQPDSVVAKLLESAARSPHVEPSRFALRVLSEAVSPALTLQEAMGLLSPRGLAAASLAAHRVGSVDVAMSALDALCKRDTVTGGVDIAEALGFVIARATVLRCSDFVGEAIALARRVVATNTNTVTTTVAVSPAVFSTALTQECAAELGVPVSAAVWARRGEGGSVDASTTAASAAEQVVRLLLDAELPIDSAGIVALVGLLATNRVNPTSVEQLFRGSTVGNKALKTPAVAAAIVGAFCRAGDFDAAAHLYKSFIPKAPASLLCQLMQGARTRAHARVMASLLKNSPHADEPDVLAETVAAYRRCGMHDRVLSLLEVIERLPNVLTASLASTLVRSVAQVPTSTLYNLIRVHEAVINAGVTQDERYVRALLYGLSDVVVTGFFKARKAVQKRDGEWAMPDSAMVRNRAGGAVERVLAVYEDAKKDEVALSADCLEAVMKVAGLIGDADLATSVLADVDTYCVRPTSWLHRHAVHAYGAAGDMEKMRRHLEAIPKSERDLRLLTRAIYFAGYHRAVDDAMAVYDFVVEQGLTPDRYLNDVLIHVVRVDPISVVLNARE